MVADAEEAMSVASAGDVQFAQYSSNLVCLDEDAEALDQNVRLAMKTIQNLGFACRLETVNAVEAWRGTLPGEWIPQCAPRSVAHAQPGGHVADHVCVGGLA